MQLPILQVIIPLLSAVFCFLLKKHKALWLVSVAAALTSLVISLSLLIKVYKGGIISYNLGDFMPPYGIELKIDLLSSLFLTLINSIALISLLFGFYINEEEIGKSKLSGIYSLFLLCLSGLLGILVTNDLFNIYVFLEISSLASYVLVSVSKEKKALTAAFEYLISGTVGATFYLLGIGFLYSMTGTLNISDMSQRIMPLYSNKIIQLGCLFIFIGLSIKIALFPLSRWLVNSYNYAPSFVSTFFSGTVTKVMIYLLIRVIYFLFDKKSFLFEYPFNYLITSLALLAIVFGAIFAITARSIKEVLAHSSVSQIGYIILGLSLNSKTGLFAAILHIVNHSIIKSSLFMTAGYLTYQCDVTKIEDLSGIRRLVPYVIAVFTLLSLALIGIPLTNGFVSKWYMMQALIESHSWSSFVIYALGSFLSLVYIWRVIEKVYFTDNEQICLVRKDKTSILLYLFFMAAMIIILGIFSHPLQLIADKICLSIFDE
ncbi:proton-conducting transporter transmembrane domain-containing protein [Wolbachia endosymbiont of Pentidionis agamae]|uniref:proton-conducting transporter transmembrane domain-containing protein n=1 Tax=Wolbachia endosymbiont of Pentidionis agamae TaxID=3110435 RepID=UPI002FD0518E